MVKVVHVSCLNFFSQVPQRFMLWTHLKALWALNGCHLFQTLNVIILQHQNLAGNCKVSWSLPGPHKLPVDFSKVWNISGTLEPSRNFNKPWKLQGVPEPFWKQYIFILKLSVFGLENCKECNSNLRVAYPPLTRNSELKGISWCPSPVLLLVPQAVRHHIWVPCPLTKTW